MEKSVKLAFSQSSGWLKKLRRISGLSLLFLMAIVINVQASTYSETVKFDLKMKKVSLKEVFQTITDRSEFKFVYNNDVVNDDQKVSVSTEDARVEDILDEILPKHNLEYKVIDRQVIVFPAEEKTKTVTPVKGEQDRSISGKVTDDNGESLPGVTVIVKGTTNGTVTNMDGIFSLNVPEGAVLSFSFVGMVTQEVTVSDQTTIDITMTSDAIGLEEVIAIGYGTQKKETLTGSISTVKSTDIVKAPVANVSNSLGGRLPGLVAVTSSGEPGYDGTTLRIRGSNTFNDNSVLVVVDGVPGRSLDRLDPNSIENVTVLKDASAAIYGSRAANGVILVTTKRGALGKPKLTFNIQSGFNQPTKMPEMTDAATYATMLNEIGYYENSEAGMNSVYSVDQIQKFKDGSDPLRYPNTDWFSDVIKPRSAQNSQNFTISGGTEKMKYFVSIGAKHQDGNYYDSGTYYNQYDFRSNIDGTITKDISFGFDVAGRLEDRNFPIYSGGDIFRGLIQSYPTSISKWPDGRPGPGIEGGRNSLVTSTDAGGYSSDKYYKFNSNLRLDVNIPWVKGLSFSGNLSIDQGFDFKKTFSKPFNLYTWDGTSTEPNGDPLLISKTYGGGNDNTPSLYQQAKNDYSKLLNGVINYETTIGENHNLKVMVGSEVFEGNNLNFDVYRDLFLSTAIEEIFAGQTTYQETGGSSSANSRLSFFSRINYRFNNKYLVELIGRYDGSYIFPEDNRFGFFPGVSLGWIASEENFWKENVSFINYFKLRGSWGQTGNDRVDAFQFLNSYLLGHQYDDDFNYPFSTYSGSAVSELKTLYENVLANPDITWEVSNQANIGFNAMMLNNKLSIEADYFYYKRSNILWPQSANVPASAGISLPSSNYGKASNQGVDGVISYSDATGNGIGYSISVNAGYAKNKVLEWGETEGIPEWQQTTGHPMGSGLYYETDGIYHTADEIPTDLTYEIGSTPEPGDVKFIDHNNDGVINADDRVRIYKNSIPTLTFGSNIDLNYKNFDLSILVQGATGGVAYIESGAGKFGNYFQTFADERWTPDNTSANGPRTFDRGNWYWANSRNTYWLRKTDYVRLKTLQLGYTIPSTMVNKIGLDNLRVYVSGYNLLTFSPDMKEFDPEMGASTTDRDAAPALNGYNYPLERVISMGLTIGF